MINGNHIELSILCGLCILEKPTEHYLISHSVISKEVIIWRFYLHDDSHVQQYYFDSRLWRLFHEGDRKILDIKCIKGLVLYFILLLKCIVLWMNWMYRSIISNIYPLNQEHTKMNLKIYWNNPYLAVSVLAYLPRFALNIRRLYVIRIYTNNTKRTFPSNRTYEIL